MIIPRVKEFQNLKIKLNLGKRFVCRALGNDQKFAISYLEKFFGENVSDIGTVNLSFSFNENYKSEEYSIEIDEKINIEYSDKLSIRNALASLVQLCTVENGIIFVEKCKIHDFPDASHRAVMIDLARGLPDITRLREDLLRISLLKSKFVHFHLMDGDGLCYLSDVFPLKNDIRGSARYSKQILKDLVEYCASLGLEIIPEIEIPSHEHALLRYDKSLACKTELENPSLAVVCAGNEGTYQFFEKLIDEVCEIFPCKYFHVGGDERSFDDIPRGNGHCHWLECSECRALLEKIGGTTIQDLYYYLMRRIKGVLDKKGKTMIMFNDQIDISKEVDLPRDIIIQFWRIAGVGRGPVEGCSFEGFAKAGFKVINSDYPNCYFDFDTYANEIKLSKFEYDKIPECAEEYRENIIGGEACFWEYGNPEYTHYLFSCFFSSALYLDKIWSREVADYNEEYQKALTKIIVGPYVDSELNISKIFGKVLAPRDNSIVSYVDFDSVDKAPYREMLERLKKIDLKTSYSSFFIEKLISVFDEKLK